jgi:hypothetical protein
MEDRQGEQARTTAAGIARFNAANPWLAEKEPLPFCAICTKAIDLYNYGEPSVRWLTGGYFPKYREACRTCVESLAEAIGWREPIVDNWVSTTPESPSEWLREYRQETMADALRAGAARAARGKRGRGRMGK